MAEAAYRPDRSNSKLERGKEKMSFGRVILLTSFLKGFSSDGCSTYAKVSQGKLEPRVIKCTFLGHSAGTKDFKLWCSESDKIIVNRDVMFDEFIMF
ncbi:hypothetical protein J1N35_007725 [Gossypium stocksii]|uniref:Retroviral polymerase SH3-like domain-containing protein n=1 Tax=Gossypium stocksii TaxID=47602 RepID=A0A9D3W821_9ROSI|nr:hypothetical protein J1N35_007725 [Gossypium stocksii]